MQSAVAYLRTSSETNVGFMKDSCDRQLEACEACAAHFGFSIAAHAVFSDPGVNGSDPVVGRPGFDKLLKFCEANNVLHVFFESCDRFARDNLQQEVAYRKLKAAGFSLYSAAAPTSFLHDTPTGKLVRNILGAIAEFDKSTVVQRMMHARNSAAKHRFRLGLRRTIFNKPKPCGRHNLLDAHAGVAAIVRAYLSESELSEADVTAIIQACAPHDFLKNIVIKPRLIRRIHARLLKQEVDALQRMDSPAAFISDEGPSV